MMTFKRSFAFSILTVLVVSAAFLTGYAVAMGQRSLPAGFPVLAQAYRILVENGLKGTPPPPTLEYGMIRGMLQAYDDPYTIFVEPVQHKLESNELQGSFGGIGVQLSRDAQGFVILHPFPDSPAIKAGVQDGDRLLAVGELVITDQTSMDAIQSAIRGRVGERVQVRIGHPPDFNPLTLSIQRVDIPLPSVTYHIDPNEPRVGVVEVNLIAASTSNEIQKAVQALQSRRASYFVLDLRDNPGGLLSAGVDIARLFLKDGVVIQQQYRGKDVETYRVEHAGALASIPLAVIINHNSASASEIIAGALKANQRAVLVGSPSFGKDTIQYIFDLSDGSSLHVTAGHWWVPGIEPPIKGAGIQPDILAGPQTQTSGPDDALQAAIRSLLQK